MIRRVAVLIAVLVAAASVFASAPQQIRLSDITVAHNVSWGRPVDPATVLAPAAGEIFVWARLDGAIEGALIHAEWFYLGGAAPRSVATDDVKLTAASTTVHFSFALPEGRAWPEGNYRVALSSPGRVLGEARFTIASPTAAAAPPVVGRPTDLAQRYTHPRVGYSFAPPAGWRLDDADTRDGVRLFTPGNDAVIEFASGLTGARLDPTSYAAGWQSVAVGPGKLLESKQRGGVEPLAGEKSYQAVYASRGALTKVIFVATADRMFVITATFATDDFTAGELLLNRVLDTLALTPRAANLKLEISTNYRSR